MDELDRLLADAMHDAASRAPSDAGLLGSVRDRSRRHRRRRAALGAAGGAAVLAVGIPFAVVLAAGPDSPAPPPLAPSSSPSTVPSPSPSLSPSASSPARPPSSPSATAPSVAAVRLVAGFSAPAFPYTLPAADGMKAPVTSMEDGSLTAFFEATEQQHHADVTVVVSSDKPTIAAAGAQTATRVRGHAGTLRTADVQPAKQYTLSWQESAGRWIQLATDDTYTPQQVVALAESLSPASLAVLPPFTVDLAPAGLAVDTVTLSTIGFRGAAGSLETVLRKRQQLANTNRKVGSYQALLTHDPGGATLAIDVPDWNATLEITVGAGLPLSDADLLRYAAGVHILNRSDPE